jgi:hypothetical protein
MDSGASADGFETAGPPPREPDALIIELPTISSDVEGATGAITVLTGLEDCPFDIKRVYWMHGASVGEVRGQHAHRRLSQLLVAVAGAFEIDITGDGEPQTFRLDTPCRGLMLRPGCWRVIRVICPSSVLMVAASDAFNEADYIRNFQDFRAFREVLKCAAAPRSLERRRHD